jgi:Fur family zinc uptake transcriptional regulator
MAWFAHRGASAYLRIMAGHHNHHNFAGTKLVDAARGALTAAGEQWTGMRGDVFEALAAQEKPASAYDIAENVGSRRGKRVAANSVYRILDLFVRTNLARRVESANAYVANSHPGCQHDCIFLICDACGQATHLDDDRLTGALREAAHHAGFAEVRPVVEIRGHCGSCGPALAPAATAPSPSV